MTESQFCSNKNLNSMKNAFFIFLMTLLLSGILLNFLPWWIIGAVAAIAALVFRTNPVLSFLAGFLGIALLWGLYAGYLDEQNESILSSQLGQIFKGLSSMGLIFTTALIGGLVGGLSAMSGSLLRKMVSQ